MQNQSLDISEIVTETSTEPSSILLEEDYDIEGLQEQKRKIISENREKKFITSLMDIEVHRKVELQNADVTKVQQIFSIDLSDIGKTPLTEMEIHTVIVCQSPRNPLPLL